MEETKKKECNCEHCKCKEGIDGIPPTIQTAFLAYQSGSGDIEIMDKVFECIGELDIALAKKGIRLYTVIQHGNPPSPTCGVPGKPPCTGGH